MDGVFCTTTLHYSIHEQGCAAVVVSSLAGYIVGKSANNWAAQSISK